MMTINCNTSTATVDTATVELKLADRSQRLLAAAKDYAGASARFDGELADTIAVAQLRQMAVAAIERELKQILSASPLAEATIAKKVSAALIAAGIRRRASGGGRKIAGSKADAVKAILAYAEKLVPEGSDYSVSSVLLSASRKATR